MQKWIKIASVLALAFTVVPGIISAQEAPAQFKDGQTTVFYGDSITHGGWYQYYVQLFYATRFPDRKIKIENAGVSGASAAGSLPRLDNDVLFRKPDLVYIMFGMNDFGRGNYKTAQADEKTMAAREGSLKTYKTSMDKTIKKIKASGVTPVIMTPTPYNQYGQSIKTENFTAANDGLTKCAEIVKALAVENKCPIVDLHAPITALLVKDSELDFSRDDRVHPNKIGHMIMAYYILQAQKVPTLVAKTVIDYTKKSIEGAENCSVENLEAKDASVKFTYTPKALPFPVSDEYSKANEAVPWDSLNQEIIQVKNLPAGDYRLLADRKEVGRFSAAQFAEGVNMASLATPQQAKSVQLKNAVTTKANVDRSLRGLVQVNCILWNGKIDPADVVASDKYLDEWLGKVSEQYKKYYTNVIKSYRKNRDKLSSLMKGAADAQEEIFKRQKTEPCVIEIVK
ncbi:MAG: hypothetical protein A2020_02670 [Lentisphaerae bacterium GWF2_45_14]|nr:MAG: hypothetical protein A2020_02670 [Lentisphaerae bacterium GWF2_45_14]